jgi:hypothetical protein
MILCKSANALVHTEKSLDTINNFLVRKLLYTDQGVTIKGSEYLILEIFLTAPTAVVAQ